MKRFFQILLILIVVAAPAAAIPAFWPSQVWSLPADVATRPAPDAKRGEYVFHMGGCASCHTDKDGKPLAGGLRLKSPFGIFVVPSITPDKERGIGKWTREEITFALQAGLVPSGDVLGGAMAKVVENDTSKLTGAGRQAIADDLMALPPRGGN